MLSLLEETIIGDSLFGDFLIFVPLLEAFFVPVLLEGHVALEFVEFDLAHLLFDRFLSFFVSVLLPRDDRGLFGLELLEFGELLF